VDAWIAPRAADIGKRMIGVAAVRRLLTAEDVQAAFARPGRRWPLLFFAIWSLIHLEGAKPDDALEEVCGTI
jgi:asparagine synthase (glutamine-hydrolysing)